MCLIAWNWQPDSATPLLLLANRDEFYARPALPLDWWQDGRVLAGRDLQAGGTWLGVDRRGRLAVLTNYRQSTTVPAPRPTRGALVAGFLQGDLDATGYLTDLADRAGDYNPFNLLVFDGTHLMGLESRNRRVVCMPVGICGVSNADFNTPWPKLMNLKAGLQQQCLAGKTRKQDLLPLLQVRTQACDAELPQTGIGRDLERGLSAAFITSAQYGTRASSVVALNKDKAGFFEQSYGPQGAQASTQFFFTPTAQM
jgi:uncharacterized protein with NRDE domain